MPRPDLIPKIPRSLRSTFTYADARAAGLSKRGLYRLRDLGLIELISRGIYRREGSPPVDEGLLAAVIKAPRATLCLATALARHGLSDAIPTAPDLALPRNTRHPVTGSLVRWHSFDPATFDIGREITPLGQGAHIGIFSPERSIIDAFRARRTEGPELGNEALKRWLRGRGAQPGELIAMARRFPRAERPLRTALEVLL